MGTPLRVLLVEDSEEDSELVLRCLRRGGYDPAYLRVETREALEAALAEGTWEAVIADHRLPSLNSPAALEIVRQRGLDIPFIIVSGIISDEIAVEAMRAGAHDYVLKGNLARLVPAIRRELGEAEERQQRRVAEAALHLQERFFRALIENATDLVLVVDGGGGLTYASPSAAKALGSTLTPAIGQTAASLVHPEDAAAFASAIETAGLNGSQGMPREMRFQFQDGSWPAFEVVATNRLHDPTVEGIVLNARDITARKRAEEQLRASEDSLRHALEATVAVVSSAVEKRDPYTAGHQRRVTELSCAIAQELHLSRERVETIRTAASLHDIGKIQVPAEILSKPGKLNDLEMGLIRSHPLAGREILKSVRFPGPVADVILQHHERLDGSGYPSGLSGDSILLEARIIAVADVVEAMVTHRPYRPALTLSQAIEELERNRGRLYDKAVTDACVDLLTSGGCSLGRLSLPTGELECALSLK